MKLTGGGKAYDQSTRLDHYSCPMVQTRYSEESKTAFLNVAKHFFDSLHEEGN